MFDLPAIVITAIVTGVLVKGIHESATFNAAMVIIKLAIVLFVIAVGAFYIDPANWQPVRAVRIRRHQLLRPHDLGPDRPDGTPLGMLAGAAIIFFAYIGFDSVSTHAEEARESRSATCPSASSPRC